MEHLPDPYEAGLAGWWGDGGLPIRKHRPTSIFVSLVPEKTSGTMTRFLSLFEPGRFGAWLRRKIWPVAGKPKPPRALTLKERMAALEPDNERRKETA